MIHVVSINNQHYYGQQLDEMFRMRHTFYVEGHGWADLTSQDGKETDEFDNEDAVYLLSLDRWGKVAAALRLNPSNRPNLTATRLSHYLDAKPPHSPEIWDMTRWIVAPPYRGEVSPGDLKPGQELGCGLMEFALDRGLTGFSIISETRLISKLDDAGWKYHPLGPPISYENGKGEAQALLLEANPESLIRARQFLELNDPVLFEIKPDAADLIDRDQTSEVESKILMEMERLGKADAVRVVQTLADELAENVEHDPAAAVDAIISFSHRLLADLKKAEVSTISNPPIQSSRASAS
ncbi:MAG: N-acyl-L-homoserine lactone synthetase-like protein [Hirschia sp.]|nr:N-acyl-L-homoserine lactone synthetase-like protein [Hirschia sp.]|tara:strand:- start:2820 stop:3707 length:888 start_codon:yes stop_codon:yes gene_type:complete